MAENRIIYCKTPRALVYRILKRCGCNENVNNRQCSRRVDVEFMDFVFFFSPHRRNIHMTFAILYVISMRCRIKRIIVRLWTMAMIEIDLGLTGRSSPEDQEHNRCDNEKSLPYFLSAGKLRIKFESYSKVERHSERWRIVENKIIYDCCAICCVAE